MEFDIRFEPGCDLVSMETRAAQHSISALHHHHSNINNSNNDSCSANNSNNISGNVPPVLKGYAIVSVKNKFRNDWRYAYITFAM